MRAEVAKPDFLDNNYLSTERRVPITEMGINACSPLATNAIRGNIWDRGLSPEQLQKVVSDWMAWFEELKEQGKCTGGHPLEREGKLVSGKQGRNVADGPFAESKEAIGGYFYLQVADENEAIEIAKENAHLNDAAEHIAFSIGSVDEQTASASLVCANLTAPVIVELLPSLLAATCGRLVLCGILDSQIELVQERLRDLGAEALEIDQEGEWVAIVV